MATPFHSRYYAEQLIARNSSDEVSRLARSLFSAKVDLNPHQVDAALFVFRSPLSKGVILADEVGLGKTIEAALIISQLWAERKRRILLVVPTSLRKQWQLELSEKFFLPSIILETGSYNHAKKTNPANPFTQDGAVVICSYHFAVRKAADIQSVPWDLIVMDEAHRLRNVYKPGNVMANTIKTATSQAPKILLTATPLQNSLLELYGLVSVIDEQVFGDVQSFRDQFVKETRETFRNNQLRSRLAPLFKRTLRKQVLEYVPYTKRISMTQDFFPTDAEQWLYEKVSDFLQRPTLHALPAGQRQLMTLILRKLLASSSFAITGTLQALVQRLNNQLAGLTLPGPDGLGQITEDWEMTDELAEELIEADSDPVDAAVLEQISSIKEELELLTYYAEKAAAIRQNAKGEALITALEQGFQQATAMGAPRKAVIFTESLRTQKYLFEKLASQGYKGEIVLFNGGNADAGSQEIYQDWLKRHAGKEIVTGSKSADMRAALTEEFRERATIMLATESAAEGINLQFCSLVVNYDLPWNPQRIEQRIGRCHRYGQKFDVVVINFLNRRNAADQRVFELLSEKFSLFDGLFGASDEVLGALESGVDFERRIADIYQLCRSPEEIQAAFDELQRELETDITVRMAETRRNLLENFDEDVHLRLKGYEHSMQAELSAHEALLLKLAQYELAKEAEFSSDEPRFRYYGTQSSAGYYHLNWRNAEQQEDFFFRMEHPLAQCMITNALSRVLPRKQLVLDYTRHGAKISALQNLPCKQGWLSLRKLTVESLGAEDYLIVTGITDEGQALDEEVCERLFRLPAMEAECREDSQPDTAILAEPLIKQKLQAISVRNSRYFDEEMVKLDGWAEDLKLGLEREIKEIDAMIREQRKYAAAALDLESKVALHREIKELEKQRSQKRRYLFDAQDEIDAKKEKLLAEIEQRLQQKVHVAELFVVRWQIV